MLPPLTTRRQRRAAELEVRVKRRLARATRWLTWAQTAYDQAVLRALRETRAALEEQQTELYRLREEVDRQREDRAED